MTNCLSVCDIVPVSDVYLATITPEGDEVPSYDGYVALNEYENLGVGCIATIEGGRVPPAMTIFIDGKVRPIILNSLFFVLISHMDELCFLFPMWLQICWFVL